MDCRTFLKHHLAFVDDTLPGADRAAMERHRLSCERCARHDAHVRRGLLLARNLAPIEPSADFYERLERRLRDVKPDRRPVYIRPAPRLGAPGRLGGVGTFGTAAFAVAACAVLAIGVAGWSGGWRTNVASPLATTATVSSDASRGRAEREAPAPSRGYRLEIAAGEAAYRAADVERLMRMVADDPGFDPAMVTSASAGLSVWPALLIADDLPRPFVEAGFSIAELAH